MRASTRRPEFAMWAADHADVVAFLTAPRFDPERSDFLADVAAQVRDGSPLTGDQVGAVRRNIARRADRAARLAALSELTEDGERRQTAPTGRVIVEGVVTDVAVRPGFNANQVDYKMVVDCDFLVWCSVPQALVLRPEAPDLGLVGAVVRFAVTLSTYPDLRCAAIGKAPRQARLISRPPSGDSTTRVA